MKLFFRTVSIVELTKTFNSLPPYRRDINHSICQFKTELLKYYQIITEHVYNVEIPRTFKTVCALNFTHASLFVRVNVLLQYYHYYHQLSDKKRVKGLPR